MTMDYVKDLDRDLRFWDMFPLLLVLGVVHKLAEVSILNQLLQECLVILIVLSQMTHFPVVGIKRF